MPHVCQTAQALCAAAAGIDWEQRNALEKHRQPQTALPVCERKGDEKGKEPSRETKQSESKALPWLCSEDAFSCQSILQPAAASLSHQPLHHREHTLPENNAAAALLPPTRAVSTCRELGIGRDELCACPDTASLAGRPLSTWETKESSSSSTQLPSIAVLAHPAHSGTAPFLGPPPPLGTTALCSPRGKAQLRRSRQPPPPSQRAASSSL